MTYFPHALLGSICILILLWAFALIPAAILWRGIVAALAAFFLFAIVEMARKRGPRRVR
jgi:hypothetical protein